jgi:hypothetical protein
MNNSGDNVELVEFVLFHPLSLAIKPKSFDWASAHSRTHPLTPPLIL